jgi:hypothetical protein
MSNSVSYIELASSPRQLFQSTAQFLEFWLSVAEKRETMPAKAYLEFLNSFGWNRRSAGPYVKLADFIKEHLLGHIDAIAKLDIRTLLKLPLARYAPIVEAIKMTEPTQAQVSELIKKLPTKPREKYKSVEEKKDETFELNVPVQTGKLISETAELMGLTRQKAIEVNCELVRQLITGVDPAAAIARFQEQFINNSAKVEEAEFVTPEDLTPAIAMVGLSTKDSDDSEFIPNPEEVTTEYTLCVLRLQDPVQWDYEGETYASWLTKVEGDEALLEVGDGVYSVPLSNLRKIDIDAIKEEISDRKKLSYPYQQLYINAVNAKQEWITLQALPDGDDTYDWQYQQYVRWMSCAVDGAKRNGIWFDSDELQENQRLILVPDGEDLIANVANQPKFKHKATKTSFLEAFSSGTPDEPSLEQRLKDADNWDEISSLVRCNNKTLTTAMEAWTIEERELLIAKLATYLENSFTCAIHEKEVSWLHHVALASALAKLEFEVNQQVCRFDKFIDYGTGSELWSFRTEKGETIVVTRNEVKVFKF